MTRLQRITVSAFAGGLIAAAFFVGDLVGAAVTVGDRFHPDAWGFGLVALLGGLTVLVGGIVGAGAGTLLRERWIPQRRFVLVALVLVFAGSLGSTLLRRSGASEPHHEPKGTPVLAERPLHVLWIVIDTLRADTLYGPGDALDFPHAPHLAELAREAVVFFDVEASAGWTLPSTATLLTGIHPVTLGAERGFLPPWAPSIADRLRAAGFGTHAFVDNALLDHVNGFSQGFDTWTKRSAMDFAWRLVAKDLLPEGLVDRLRHGLPISYRGADVVTDEALAHVESADGKPQFVYVHYMDVHTPYRMHAGAGPPPEGAEELPPLDSALRGELRHDPAFLSGGQKAMIEHLYAAELTFVDAQIGRLLAAFDARFGREDSLVLVTSDHGEEFYEHGSFGHGWTLYQELVRVPLIMRFPSSVLPSESRVQLLDAPVGLVDVVPTTLATLGLPIDDGDGARRVQGHSLLAWIAGREGPPTRPLFATQRRFGRELVRWREDGFATISLSEGRGDLAYELYDKKRDYPEADDLVAREADRLAELRARLEGFLGEQSRLRDPRAGEGSAAAATLEALGYAGN